MKKGVMLQLTISFHGKIMIYNPYITCMTVLYELMGAYAFLPLELIVSKSVFSILKIIKL